MKIIGINHNYDTDEKGFDMFLMADSSLLKDGKPFFIPSFDDSFKMYPSLVIKICRLGKNIAKRFAHRYYDSYSYGLNVRAESLLKSLSQNNLPWTMAVAFDSSAIMGDFKDITSENDLNSIRFEIKQNGEIISKWDISSLTQDIDTIIETISMQFTLKIGDLIYVGFSNDGFECAINDEITATDNNGDRLLNFKVK